MQLMIEASACISCHIYYSNMHTIINIYSINTVSAHATDEPFAIVLQV